MAYLGFYHTGQAIKTLTHIAWLIIQIILVGGTQRKHYCKPTRDLTNDMGLPAGTFMYVPLA